MGNVLVQRAVISVGIFLAATGSAVAGWFGADFSADTYQLSAQQQSQVGKMYVSGGKVRTEMTVRDKKMVEIIDPDKGLAWLLDPQVKRYRERVVPKRDEAPSEDNPCRGQAAASCQRLGEEMLNGRKAQKWRRTLGQQQQVLWLDSEHHFPLQLVIDGKAVMSMRYLGQERIGERTVEKWEARENSPQGAQLSLQWYDPQLNIAVRQQAANGAVRELRNIRLGEQPAALFRPPEDYQRIAPR
jgi:hypothetical protein